MTLLSKGDCNLCEHAKEVLERVGLDHPMRVEVIPLESPEGRRLAANAGLIFAPGVLLDGKPFSHGRLSEAKLRKELEKPRT
ncbi:MAG: glutaredoxin family protein [Candidatus Dormibacteria bacterium]